MSECETEQASCPRCGTEMQPFTWSRDGYDYEYGMKCCNCGWEDA